MPHENLQIVMKAEDILKKSDFEAKFEQVLKLLLAMEKRNTEAIYKLQQDHSKMMSKMGEEYNGHYSELKGKAEDKVSKIHNEMKMSMNEFMEEMKKMMSEMMDKKIKDVDSKMEDVDSKMAKVKDGISGLKGEMGLMGPMPTTEMIQKAIDKPFEEFKKELREKVQQIGSRNRILAGPNANAVLMADLSSQCNGITRTFTVPRHRIVRGLTSSQAPFVYRPTVDFTTANLVLTINSALEPPAEGQSLLFDYVK